jgi:hypothetical protein
LTFNARIVELPTELFCRRYAGPNNNECRDCYEIVGGVNQMELMDSESEFATYSCRQCNKSWRGHRDAPNQCHRCDDTASEGSLDSYDDPTVDKYRLLDAHEKGGVAEMGCACGYRFMSWVPRDGTCPCYKCGDRAKPIGFMARGAAADHRRTTDNTHKLLGMQREWGLSHLQPVELA